MYKLPYKTYFLKCGQTYRNQVVNPQHLTPQGQPVAKAETPLYPNWKYPNWEYKFDTENNMLFIDS